MIITIIYWARLRPFIKIYNNLRWYMGRLAPGTYDGTCQVMNNFALLDIELERERDFRFILKPLATCWR